MSEPPVFLQFADHNGKARTAKIPRHMYTTLLEAATKYDRVQRLRQQRWADAIRQAEEQFIRLGEHMNGFPFPGYGNKTPSETPLEALIRLAGVEKGTSLSVPQLTRKAQRKCHPDTGGSHELWLELQKVLEKI